MLTYGSVIAGGLLVGFCLPRPGQASNASAATSAAAAEAPMPADVDAPSALEPMPVAMDGAESPELRALRQAERRLLGGTNPDAPASKPQPTASLAEPDPADSCTDATCNAEGADFLPGLRMPDLPVHADRRIQGYLHYFTNNPQGRKIFRAWLKRSGRYRGVVETALREHALPRDLISLVFIESGFSPFALSQAGAVGLWQFMPETARAYGLSVEADYDERRSIARASDAATRHLSDLYEKFGSWELAMAAYDLGYKGMLDRVKDTGSNDYWTLSKIDGALPQEAVLYVPKVLAVAILLNNLERFGFDDTHVDPPVATANLEVPPGIDLATIARAAGTSVQHLRELNPELLTDQIPDRGSVFITHVPAGGLARANAMLPRLLDRRERDGLENEVGRGFDWGRDEVPRRGGASDDMLDAPRPHAYAPRPFPSLDPENPPRTVFYRVGDRETLADVARNFGVSVDEIVQQNYLDPSANLQRGMLLSIDVRPDVMARMAKKRAAARLEKQDAESANDGASGARPTGPTPGDELASGGTSGPRPAWSTPDGKPKDEPDVLRGYAMAMPARSAAQRPSNSVPSDPAKGARPPAQKGRGSPAEDPRRDGR